MTQVPSQPQAKFQRLNSFEEAPELLAKNVALMGITVPTEIQAQSYYPALEGKDILALSATGSGKTLGFVLPLCARLLSQTETSKLPQVLVLTPTRELGAQIAAVLQRTLAGTPIKHVCILGGESYQRQKSALKSGCHIVVGTPGRIADLLRQGSLPLGGINALVLDEMDQMLEIGFAEQVAELRTSMPITAQVLLFSATMPHRLQIMINSLLKNPVSLKLNNNESLKPKIDHIYMEIQGGREISALTHALQQKNPDQALIFVDTKYESGMIHEALSKRGFRCGLLNSDLSQADRARTLAGFNSGDLRYLVATNVAARGIDIKDLPLVVNMTVPSRTEDYVHRTGRTGRAGKTGESLTLVSPSTARKYKDILRTRDLTAVKLEPATKQELLKAAMQSLLTKQLNKSTTPSVVLPGFVYDDVKSAIDEVSEVELRAMVSAGIVEHLALIQPSDPSHFASNRPLVDTPTFGTARFGAKSTGGGAGRDFGGYKGKRDFQGNNNSYSGSRDSAGSPSGVYRPKGAVAAATAGSTGIKLMPSASASVKKPSSVAPSSAKPSERQRPL